MVQSLGPFHGLPTYQNGRFSNLTAVVTGANGISGYHMVRVLAAAPERWSKIYCFSRKPPPANFFDDLGEGAKRVEHISVDFLGDPTEIAARIKDRIATVYVLPISASCAFHSLRSGCFNRDYIFFFSYMQPQQEGSVLGMWSDADALAEVNCMSTHPALFQRKCY